jgi:hypothetical protein
MYLIVYRKSSIWDEDYIELFEEDDFAYSKLNILMNTAILEYKNQRYKVDSTKTEYNINTDELKIYVFSI